MRSIRTAHLALPIVVALSLAACNRDEPAAEGALTGEEVAGIADNGTALQPGEYSASQELIEIDAPGASEQMLADMRAAFAEGADEPQLLCVTEGMTREQWLSALAQSNCTLANLTAEGGSIEGAMSCNAEEGLNGRVEFAGTMQENASDLAMTTSIPMQSGEARVRFSVRSQGTGESCG